MANNEPVSAVLEAYIRELEALITKWETATDPESRWVLRLLRQALLDARAAAPVGPFPPIPAWLKSSLH